MAWRRGIRKYPLGSQVFEPRSSSRRPMIGREGRTNNYDGCSGNLASPFKDIRESKGDRGQLEELSESTNKRMWRLALVSLVFIAHTAENVLAEEDCNCVPFYLCQNHTIHSSGLIDINSQTDGPCPNYLDVCCGSPPITARPLPFKNRGCGIRNLEGIGFKVTGLQDGEAQFGEFPWMVAVLRVEQADPPELYQCGGSLIHPQVVLTGAHCVAGKEDLQLKIRAGEWDTITDKEIYDFEERYVDRIVYHEDFKENNLFNDVALLFLKKPLEPSGHIGFACLPPQDLLPAPGTRCYTSGWGKDLFGKKDRYQGILKKVELPVVENQQCQALLRTTRLGNYFRLHNSFMCAGGEKGSNTCKGDGGSPLICPILNSPIQYMQSGIVAWGIGCGENEIPGVYANVAMFRNWIDTKMAEAQLDSSYYTY